MNDVLFSAFIALVGVLCGIKAAMGGIRLDWAECLLVVGVVLITLGVRGLFKGGYHDEF
jgi:type IV secretory pathway VirB2 component (pilin)